MRTPGLTFAPAACRLAGSLAALLAGGLLGCLRRTRGCLVSRHSPGPALGGLAGPGRPVFEPRPLGIAAMGAGLGRLAAGLRGPVRLVAVRMAVGQPAADQQPGGERVDGVLAATRHFAPPIQARTVLAVLA